MACSKYSKTALRFGQKYLAFNPRTFTTRAAGERDSVTIAVPATSANLGPGFDTLGMALDIWNTLKVERSDKFEMEIIGEGADELPRNESNLVCKALSEAFKSAGKPVPPLKYTCIQKIPHSRGMGSSSAAIVSGCLAGLVLSGHDLPVRDQEEFLQIASHLEGHPDNVAPAIYGGLQIGINTESARGYLSTRVSIPHGLGCVLFVPTFQAPTKEARAVLPEMYSKKDVIFNLGRIATLISAFETRRFDKIKWGVQDVMHQTYRSNQFPHLFPCIEAAESAGAVATYLSGAGPTIMSFVSGCSGDAFGQRLGETSANEVATAMKDAANSVGIEGSVYFTTPSQIGAQVVDTHPKFSEKLQRLSAWGQFEF